MIERYQYKQRNVRILSLVPTSRGTGYVVVETPPFFVCHRSVVAPKEDRGEWVIELSRILAWNRPYVLLLEDIHSKHFRRQEKTRLTIADVIGLASGYGIEVQTVKREAVCAHFGVSEDASKIEIARLVAEFLDDPSITKLVPQERRLWEAEPHWMPMFEALALILTALKAD